jgi:hypothetical protein
MEFEELPLEEQIRIECWKIQQSWTDEQRAARSGCIADEQQASSVKQFLVHHREPHRWAGGTAGSVDVWRCVDGR